MPESPTRSSGAAALLHRAPAAFGEAVDLYARAGRGIGQSSALVGLGGTHEYRDERGAALQCYERALALAEELDDPYSRGGALYFRAWLRIVDGDVEAGAADCDAALAIGERHGFEDMIHETSWIRGIAHARRGAFERAHGDFQRAASGSYRLVRAYGKMLCGVASLRLARTQAAGARFDESIALCVQEASRQDVPAFTLETLAMAQAGRALLGGAGAEHAAESLVRRIWHSSEVPGTPRYMCSCSI